MGLRGPQPKPVELKVLEGNRGNRPLDLSGIFRPQAGLPDAPRWLNPHAKKTWKRLSAELLHYNLLASVDREAFAMLCQTAGRVEEIEIALAAKQALLKSEGKDPMLAFTDETPNGLRIQSVTYQLLNKEQAKLFSLLKSFGLRPDARAAVTSAIRAQTQLFDANGAPGPAAAGANSPAAPVQTPPMPAEPRSFDDF